MTAYNESLPFQITSENAAGLKLQNIVTDPGVGLGAGGILWRANLGTGAPIGGCNVVYSPNGGMAQVYVRPTSGGWSNSPGITQLETLAKGLYLEATGTVNVAHPAQIYADFKGALGDPPAIFVRMELANGVQATDFTKNYLWFSGLDAGGAPIYRTIAQFIAARTLSVPAFNWPEFAARIDELNDKSPGGSRTGDILIVSDARNGYYLLNAGDFLPGYHGGPEVGDSLVPLMFNIPGDVVVDKSFIRDAISAQTTANGGNALRNWQMAPVLKQVFQTVR